MLSDVYSAADEFIERLAEHSDPAWDEDDKTELARRLTDRAVEILRDPEETW